jgi:hypothetical protein
MKCAWKSITVGFPRASLKWYSGPSYISWHGGTGRRAQQLLKQFQEERIHMRANARAVAQLRIGMTSCGGGPGPDRINILRVILQISFGILALILK